jgi:TolA-binding protein
MGRAEATLGLARVSAAQGNVELASRHYAQLRSSWPATAAGLLSSLEEYRLLLRYGMQVEAEAVLSQAFNHYRAVIANFGAELPALRAAGYLSEVLGYAHDWDQGVAFLDSIADTYGQDPLAGSLLVRAARIAAQYLNDPQRAQLLLQRVAQRYPASDLAVAIRPFADSLRAAPGAAPHFVP